MQVFLVFSTCLLYLVAAGLFSRAVGYFEQQQWNNIIGGDAQELGDGPGTYDVDKVVWHVNVSFSLTPPPPKKTANTKKRGKKNPKLTNHPFLVFSFSAAARSSTAAAAGASSTPFSAGTTRPPTAPSSPTTSTGSWSWPPSWPCGSARPGATGPFWRPTTRRPRRRLSLRPCRRRCPHTRKQQASAILTWRRGVPTSSGRRRGAAATTRRGWSPRRRSKWHRPWESDFGVWLCFLFFFFLPSPKSLDIAVNALYSVHIRNCYWAQCVRAGEKRQ